MNFDPLRQLSTVSNELCFKTLEKPRLELARTNQGKVILRLYLTCRLHLRECGSVDEGSKQSFVTCHDFKVYSSVKNESNVIHREMVGLCFA